MTYVITGLPIAEVEPLFDLSDTALAERGVIRGTFEHEEAASVRAYNAAHGCYSARIDRP